MTVPRFYVGQVIRHNKFGYRGVVAGVDSRYAGTEQWYARVANSAPPKNRPWYTILVDGKTHTTYVAERHLDVDDRGDQIDHPALGLFFDRFAPGRYFLRRRH